MEIFKKLLLPISSEFFNENVIERVKNIVEVFGSELVVAYIVEKKTMEKVNEVAELFLTEEQRKEMEEEVINESKLIASYFFKKIEKEIGEHENMIVFGEYSEEIKKIVEEKEITCVVTSFEKECLLKYRLFEMLPIPILVEFGKGEKRILGVCSNLAPNKRVPKITLEMAEKMNYEPFFIYIVDKEEKVEVDEHGHKIERDLDYLKMKAKKFVEKYKDKATIRVSIGTVENEAAKYADEINADLVVVGREMKRKGIFGKEIKKEMVEKVKHSLLLLN